MKRVCVLAIAAAIFLMAVGAQAAMLQFEGFLDGLQETPPVATPGFGDVSLLLDDTTGDWLLTGSFADLIGTTTAAHIHGPAPVGTPAGIITPLTVTLGVTDGTLSGAGTFLAAQMADLQGGLYYVNVHTTVEIGGEIRGQLDLVPEPASFALLGVGAIGLLGIAWRRRGGGR